MSRLLLLDTDVWVDHLRGHPAAAEYVHANADRILLCPITLAELYAGARESELSGIDAQLASFPVVPVTGEAGKLAGDFGRAYGKSHGLGLADALIAAIARVQDAELGTLNVRHYPMFEGLKPPYVKR